LLMLGYFLASCLLVASGDTSGATNTVHQYLAALKVFDHERMSQFWADDAAFEDPDGSTHPLDRDRMRAMRGFERVMRTKWSWAITEASDSAVTVRLAEENDLYNLLGSGTCVQTVIYSVLGGRITRMRTTEIAYAGHPFRETFRAFEGWLLTTSAAADATLIRDGHMRFTAESAQHLRRWLNAWHARENSDDSRRNPS
jgi:hypothetical protein